MCSCPEAMGTQGRAGKEREEGTAVVLGAPLGRVRPRGDASIPVVTWEAETPVVTFVAAPLASQSESIHFHTLDME